MVSYGYSGKILRIRLSTQKISIDETPDIGRTLMGGLGLGTYYLNKEVPPEVEPLSSENKIIMTTGPLQGSIVPIQGRYCITTKSPLTNLFINSQVGGSIGPELKYAGYDGFVIEGRSIDPVYISITSKGAEIRQANELRKHNCTEKEKIIQEELEDKNAKIMSIGIAGEYQVPIACVTSETFRTAGRGGIGAVFGSKNLLGVAISSESHDESDSADSENLENLVDDLKQRVRDMKAEEGWINKYGTPYLVGVASERDQLPTKNFQFGSVDDPDLINEKGFHEPFNVKKRPCHKCIISCAHNYQDMFAFARKGEMVPVPEYESIGMLGPNCGIMDPVVIIKANYLANNYGLDTISLGNTIGFYMECSERKLLPKEFIRERVVFGDQEGFLELIKKIAYNLNVGKILGKGTKYTAEVFGKNTKKIAMNVKGLEHPAWDPRGKLGLGISFAVASEGASHLRGWPSTNKIPNEPITKEVMESLVLNQDLKLIKDSLIICHFTHSISPPLDLTDTQNLYSAMTGFDTDVREIARNIWQLNRYYNIKQFTQEPRSYDKLAYRFMQEPLPTGSAKGSKAAVDEADFEQGLSTFYELRECTETGDLEQHTKGKMENFLNLS